MSNTKTSNNPRRLRQARPAIALAGGGLLLWRPAPESAQAFFRAGPSGLAVAGSF
jgi:hypothetical protein